MSYRQALDSFREPLPERGSAGLGVVNELAAMAEPGLQKSAGPRSCARVCGNSHPVGVAAEWLTNGWGQNAGNHHAAPSAAAVEEITDPPLPI